MAKLLVNEVTEYVETNISYFHKERIDKLETLKLSQVLAKKNPYLFRAKNILTAEQIVNAVVDAFASSSEETIFGNWLEGLAVFINSKVYGGWK
jgi:hypothetical protein